MAFFDSVKIKDIVRDGLEIPGNNNLYNSEPWFLFAKNNLLKLLKRLYGNRELFDNIILEDDGHLKTTPDILDEVKDYIDSLFTVNTWKYKHLYDLYCAEYNPIWNVDGKEEETITRTTKNTGTQENKNSGKDTLEKTGKESVEKTGNETDEPSGTETLQKQGSITEANSGGVENGRTTFDSSTFLGTDKSTDTLKHTSSYGKDGNGNNDPYKETTSFTTRKDTHTYHNVKDETSFTNRKDETTYGKTDTRTDNLTENENVSTIKVRQGNIGVTSTQKLFSEEVNVAMSFRFLEGVALDIATTISYSY